MSIKNRPFKMILWIIVFCYLLIVSNGISPTKSCLTGYMTDVQSWVDEEGSLSVDEAEAQNAINLYSDTEPVINLQQQMTMFRSNKQFVKYLGMAKCGLNRVPPVFELKDTTGRPLSETVYYITLFGNQFQDVSSEGDQYDININATDASEVRLTVGYGRQAIATWSAGFNEVNFPKLRELDLRSCGIQVLSDRVFYRMQQLQALYLGENRIMHISAESFYGLVNLIHLDLSRNYVHDETNEIRNIRWDNHYVFAGLTNLQSLDMSHTRLGSTNINVLMHLGKKFQRLSLCWSGIPRLGGNFFNGTSLKYLDLSGNNGILNGPNVLGGTENTLTVLYAENIGLKTFEIFNEFDQLEILKLTNNEVSLVTAKLTSSLESIRVLDLDNNRITTWFAPIYSFMSRLKLLSLKDNNINMITEDMIRDFENISYIALSGNYMVCNCHSRDLFELAIKNEENYNESYLVNYEKNAAHNELSSFHTAYDDFNDVIRNRKNVIRACTKQYCEDNIDFDELEFDGNFVLIDYSRSVYECLSLPEGTMFPISGVQKCNTRRDIDYEDIISENRHKLLFLLVIPVAVLPVLIFCYVFRRNFKYFLITMRNSAMLSLINKNSTVDDDTIYNYDVFVSYCNEDREWVLDYLLPHVERDCSVSVCLHERDFQVGLSILENIVSCMDRSRFIMLIISQKFLLSQWCQFEMHLAQHRLLETRREDLILVLLEEIPRRVRPTTLHYLMLTKTYIVWPKDKNDHAVFWRRLKKSLITDKLKRVENTSLA